MLSVIIITKNEAYNISACLESVAWATEIIVVDSGSNDETIAICESYGARIFHNPWAGFGSQKNYALSLAKQPWILSIDADERVSPELRKEIERTLTSPTNCIAWKIPRLSSFCGQYIYHSGWWPDYVTRLFHRDHAKFTNDAVHERVIVNGVTGKLKEHLTHESIQSFEQLLAKMNSYTTTGALMMSEKNISGSLIKALLHGVWAFIRTYIIKQGFLDGKYGFILAVITAENAYYRYLKLMLLNKKL